MRLGRVCVHFWAARRGAPTPFRSSGLNRIVAVQREIRGFNFAALFEQNLNPGSDRVRATHEFVSVLFFVGAVGGHFEAESFLKEVVPSFTSGLPTTADICMMGRIVILQRYKLHCACMLCIPRCRLYVWWLCKCVVVLCVVCCLFTVYVFVLRVCLYSLTGQQIRPPPRTLAEMCLSGGFGVHGESFPKRKRNTGQTVEIPPPQALVPSGDSHSIHPYVCLMSQPRLPRPPPTPPAPRMRMCPHRSLPHTLVACCTLGIRPTSSAFQATRISKLVQ
jgi:hypothetical protein